MKKGSILKLILSASLLAAFSLQTQAAVKMPVIFSDHMVLQRDVPIKIWGWADKNEAVQVQFNGKSYQTKADNKGKWEVSMDALPAGGPYEMVIKGKSNEIAFGDILMGDVWIGSGQSNMEFRMSEAMPLTAEDLPKANHPDIRLFRVGRTFDFVPQEDLSGGTWAACTPETVKEFSAVAYYFGKDIQDNLNVPVGLIDCAWGGTDIETWTSWDVMSKDKRYERFLKKNEKQIKEIQAKEKLAYTNAFVSDKGTLEKWHLSANTPKTGWEPIMIPSRIEKTLPSFDGVVFYQTTVDIPQSLIGGDAVINFGGIDDLDVTYFNETEIGTTDGFLLNRNYKIPANIIKPGKNVIMMKMVDTGGDGGFMGRPEDVFMEIGGKKIDLAGEWLYKVSFNAADMNYSRPGFGPNVFPSLLFNAMINPITKLPVKGVIWYQGENNAGDAYNYRAMFKNMINDWRDKWGTTMPFYWVQLASYMKPDEQPSASSWAELREAQHLALSLPETGEAVIIDAGDANDIHPKDKKTVGHRLALNALHGAYGKDIVYSGPVYKSMKVENGKIILDFSNTGSGLMAKGADKYGYLNGFAIAGADKKFVWAKAYISGDKVIVFSDEVPSPVAVRYAWADNPEEANLFNREGLPASPFRTDDWKLYTQRGE